MNVYRQFWTTFPGQFLAFPVDIVLVLSWKLSIDCVQIYVQVSGNIEKCSGQHPAFSVDNVLFLSWPCPLFNMYHFMLFIGHGKSKFWTIVLDCAMLCPAQGWLIVLGKTKKVKCREC